MTRPSRAPGGVWPCHELGTMAVPELHRAKLCTRGPDVFDFWMDEIYVS